MSDASGAEPRYPYVVVELAEAQGDEASARLFDLGACGIEQRDPPASNRDRAGDGARVTFAAAFETEQDAQGALDALPQSWSPRLEHVVGDAWQDEWKKYFEPFRLCEGVIVGPPWRPCVAAPGEQLVVLEPGRAFGTGLHETTRLVAEAMAGRRARVRGAEVLDVGCGSGVLSLAALALGAERIRAIDVDPDAVAVTLENAARNSAGPRVVADTTPARDLPGSYRVVLANIEALALVDLAPALLQRTAQGGMLVLSGILGPESGPQWARVRQAYGSRAIEHIGTRGEWLAAVLRP